jgi:hypothetical protein
MKHLMYKKVGGLHFVRVYKFGFHSIGVRNMRDVVDTLLVTSVLLVAVAAFFDILWK